MVLLAGALAWVLVGGFVGSTCLLLKLSAARHPSHTPETAVPERVAKVSASAKAEQPPAQAAHPTAVDKAVPPKPAVPPAPISPAQPALPASERLLADAPPDFQNHGTQVDFVDSPDAAARLATQERKLCFIIHLSGNFEDARFT
jgi:hypothetical protein